jgi:DNA-binding SARP family transcriptional activator/tetratricopeptide (TPR) repeat protein
MLRIRLIGEMALEIDGTPSPTPASRRARSLLAWLALHPGPHPRAQVAALFWPDVLDTSARTNLRSALLTLRTELGAAGARHLVTSRDAVGLPRGDEIWVDALEFEDQLRANRPEGALDLGEQELLAGLDDEWVYAARDAHRERLGEALRRLATAAEGGGDLAAAVRWARRLVALDPLSEEANRGLIRLLAAGGDRSAALAAFAKLRERLAGELRVAPSLETRRLIETIRADHGVSSTSAAEVRAPRLPPRLAIRSGRPFVGREEPLEVLRAAWLAARDGGRRMMLITGEPGIGKTRLAAELAAFGHAKDATVLYGRCHLEAVTPYEPFTEALRHYIASCPPDALGPLLGSGAGELARILPGLAERLPGLPPPMEGDPDGDRYRLFEAVASALATAAAAAGAVLVLDDLQWADRPTLLLLQHIVRASEPGQLLLLGTCRAAELAPGHSLAEALAELRGEGLADVIALEGLGEPELAELIAALTGKTATEAFTQAIRRETEGNPFFVEEVLRHLGESGALAGDEPTPSRVLDQAGVPEGVKELIGRRLARLGERTNHVLVIAAVAGRGFDYDVLEPLAGLDEDELLASLEEAVRANVIIEEPGVADRFAFTHALVRETLYEALSGTRRIRLHRRIAEALETVHGADLESYLPDLAYHFGKAARGGEDADKAVKYAGQAGEQALGLIAYEEAAGHYERALECLELKRPVDDSVRCELLLGLGGAQVRAGWFTESRATFERAADIARGGGDHGRLARAALGAGGGEDRIPAPWRVDDALVALLEEALESVDGDHDPGLQARLLARLALELYWSEQRRERRDELSRRGLELARRADDRAALGYCLVARRFAVWGPDDLEQRLEGDSELQRLAEESGNEELALQSSWAHICDLLELGDLETADVELGSYERLAHKRRSPYHMFGAACWQTMRAISQGPPEKAERMAEQTFDFGRQVLPHRFLPFHALAVQVYVIRRDQGRLGEHMDTTRALADRFSEFPVWRAALAALHAELGHEAEARTELETLAGNDFADLPRDFLWLATVAWLGEACALTHDPRRAEALYELMLPHSGKHVWAGYTNVPLGPSSRVLGLLATAMGRWEEAARHFEDALELARRVGARPNHARTQKAYTEMLLARNEPGDPEKALELLDEVLATAEELGMKRLLDEASALRLETADLIATERPLPGA